jgi:hypothetical protein
MTNNRLLLDAANLPIRRLLLQERLVSKEAAPVLLVPILTGVFELLSPGGPCSYGLYRYGVVLVSISLTLQTPPLLLQLQLHLFAILYCLEYTDFHLFHQLVTFLPRILVSAYLHTRWWPSTPPSDSLACEAS